MPNIPLLFGFLNSGVISNVLAPRRHSEDNGAHSGDDNSRRSLDHESRRNGDPLTRMESGTRSRDDMEMEEVADDAAEDAQADLDNDQDPDDIDNDNDVIDGEPLRNEEEEVTIDLPDEDLDTPPRRVRGRKLTTFSTMSTYTSETTPEPGFFGRCFNSLKNVFFPSTFEGRHAEEFIPNYRLLPIVSGILVPFSILLEIPGLTEHWYVRTEGNKAVEYRPNPIILDVGLAISMASAAIANAALVTRFLEKRVKIMTLIAIFALTVHDIINIIAVSVFGVVHRFSDGFTYAEAFWMTVFSTVVSMITNLTLIYDFVATPNFSASASGLTRKQRSLVIAVIILLCYVGLGAMVYSFLMHLTFQDALYFTVVTIETIGFGDYVPNTTGARVFSFFYDTIGILNLALLVGTTRETVIEGFENSYRKRRAAMSQRRKEHKFEKARAHARRVIIERMLKEAGLPLYVNQTHARGRGGLGHVYKVFNEQALGKDAIKAAELEACESIDKNADAVTLQHDLSSIGISGEAHDEAYRNFRKEIKAEQKKEFQIKLSIAWGIFVTFWIVGSVVFMFTEKWAYGTSMYFCFIAFTTIGYGDFSPTSPAGRAVFVVWALLGVGSLTILISVLSEAYSSRYKDVLTHGAIRKAVKISFNTPRESASSAPSDELGSEMTANMPEEVFVDDTTRAKQKILDAANELLHRAKTFHDHIHFFSEQQKYGASPSPALAKLLSDMAETEHMNEALKKEVLQDQDARTALFMTSYDRTIHRLMETAQAAAELLQRDAERVSLAERNLPRGVSEVIAHAQEAVQEQPYNQRKTTFIHHKGMISEPNLS